MSFPPSSACALHGGVGLRLLRCGRRRRGSGSRGPWRCDWPTRLYRWFLLGPWALTAYSRGWCSAAGCPKVASLSHTAESLSMSSRTRQPSLAQRVPNFCLLHWKLLGRLRRVIRQYWSCCFQRGFTWLRALGSHVHTWVWDRPGHLINMPYHATYQ